MAQSPTAFQRLTRMFGFPGQTPKQQAPSFNFNKDELLKTDSREEYELPSASGVLFLLLEVSQDHEPNE